MPQALCAFKIGITTIVPEAGVLLLNLTKECLK
jgi:hypothetical protein